MIEKFWTVKNGQIGTAHLNRNSKVVDFRKYHNAVLGLHNKTINLRPEKSGQINPEPLVLKVEKEEETIEKVFEGGSERRRKIYFGSFQGVEIKIISGGTYLFWPSEAMKMDAEEKERLEREAWKQSQENIVKNAKKEIASFLTPENLAGLNTRVVRRFLSGRKELYEVIVELLPDAWRMIPWQDAAVFLNSFDANNLRIKILFLLEERRKEKKLSWERRKNGNLFKLV